MSFNSSGQTPVAVDRVVSALKRYAKKAKRVGPEQKLSRYQDQVAISLGYNNWSMLHRHVVSMSADEIATFSALVERRLGVGIPASKPSTLEPAVETWDEESAREEMRSFVLERYTPLNDFAFFDAESDNGFAWPEVDLIDPLLEHFGEKYPEDLISAVAAELEVSSGPWGVED